MKLTIEFSTYKVVEVEDTDSIEEVDLESHLKLHPKDLLQFRPTWAAISGNGLIKSQKFLGDDQCILETK